MRCAGHFSHLTTLAIVADRVEIQEMCPDQCIVHSIHILELYLNPLTERWKHFREDDLLVPMGRVAALLYRCSTLGSET